jgi:hypothetical protein
MQRRTLLQLVSTGLLAPLTALRYALAEEATPQQGLRKLKGEVSIDGVVAQPGTLIKPGSTVSTAPGSEAIYVVGKDAFLQRGGATVKFESSDVLRVITGRILSVFAKGERRIETPTATIGIRGTGCYIEATDEQVYFCLCYGAADLTPTADNAKVERIVTSHHDHPLYINRGQAMPVMVPANVINHYDAELVLLESLVGRKAPFDTEVANPYR